jgi:hypothetical protein
MFVKAGLESYGFQKTPSLCFLSCSNAFFRSNKITGEGTNGHQLTTFREWGVHSGQVIEQYGATSPLCYLSRPERPTRLSFELEEVLAELPIHFSLTTTGGLL